jgi:ribosomal-protein-serine acetyltransferase
MSTPIKPTLIDLPETLCGQRVFLRPYCAADAEQVFAAIDESRDFLRPWMPWVDDHATVEDTREFCIRCAASWLLRTELPLAIFEVVSGRYVGSTGFHEPDWELRSFEIGYWLRVTAVGFGYMTEAVRLVTELAFTSLRARRVHLSCEAHNEASQRVAERAGFVLEGRLRNGLLATDGSAVDALVYSLIPEEWSQLQATRALETTR